MERKCPICGIAGYHTTIGAEDVRDHRWSPDPDSFCTECGHPEHPADICEADLGEFGECHCVDDRYRKLRIGGSYCMPIYALALPA